MKQKSCWSGLLFFSNQLLTYYLLLVEIYHIFLNILTTMVRLILSVFMDILLHYEIRLYFFNFSDGLLVISNWNQFYESSRIKAFRFYLFLMNQKTNMDVFCSFGRKELGNHNQLQNVWYKLVFMGNSTLQEKFNFCFLEDFCWYLHIFFS